MTLFNELTRMLNPYLGTQGFSKIHEYVEYEGATFRIEATYYGFDRQFCPIEFEISSISIDEYDWEENLSKKAYQQVKEKVINMITLRAKENVKRNMEDF